MLADVMSLPDPWWLGVPETLGGGAGDSFQCLGMKWACFERCQALLAFTPLSRAEWALGMGDGPAQHWCETGDGPAPCQGD